LSDVRTNNDPFEMAAGSRFERLNHGVSGFADRDHKNAMVGMQIVQIVANAQHAMVALDATDKRFGNAGFRERLLKNVARAVTHALELQVGGGRHQRNYNDGRRRLVTLIIREVKQSFFSTIPLSIRAAREGVPRRNDPRNR